MPLRAIHPLAWMLCFALACAGDQGTSKLQSNDPPDKSDPPSANGAVAELREQLQSDDAVTRSAAAGRLIQMQTAEALQAIEEVLLSGKEAPVVDLLKVIGLSKDLRLLPMVVHRLKGTTDAIVAATLACLEAFDHERVADEAIGALERKDLGVPEISRLAEALGRTRQRKAVPALVDLFEIPEPAIHDKVVSSLYLVTGHRFRSAEEWKGWWTANQERSREEWQEEALRALQGDPTSDVGAELARTKIEFLALKLSLVPEGKPEDRTAIVLEALAYARAPQVRVFGATEAAKLPAAERGKALAPLLVLAKQDSADEVREASFEAVGAICWEPGSVSQAQRDAAPVLGAGATQDPVARVRVAAIHGLARLHASLAVDRIRLSLADPDVSVKVAAVESLGRMESPVAVTELINLLPKAESPDLRKAIVDAMGESGAASTVPLLTGLLREAAGDDARPLRWSIANALAKIKSKDGLRPLGQLAEDHFLDVRVKAIQGLGAAGGAEEVSLLTAVLKTTARDPKERSAAALALGQIGDEAAIPDLLAALAGDEAVSGDAWKAILSIVGKDPARAVAVSRKLVEAKQWARAAELLDPAAKDGEFAKTSPAGAAEACDLLGQALLGQGNRAEALPYLKDAAERSAAPAEAKLRYVRALKELKRHDDALALVDQMVHAEPAGTEFYWALRVQKVDLLRDEKKLPQAIAEAERVLAENGLPAAAREEVTKLRDLAKKGTEAAQHEESAMRGMVARLLEDLESKSEARRASGIDGLKRLGRKAVPALLGMVLGEDASRWESASQALAAITGIPGSLDAHAPEADRQKAAETWRTWYERK